MYGRTIVVGVVNHIKESFKKCDNLTSHLMQQLIRLAFVANVFTLNCTQSRLFSISMKRQHKQSITFVTGNKKKYVITGTQMS